MAARSGSKVRWGTAACALAVLLSLPALPAHGAPPDHHGKRHKAHKAHKKTVAQKKPTAPPAPPPLDGTSYDYDYAGGEGHPERRWLGRVFVHRRAAAAATQGQSLPVLVFMHGNNGEKIKYRWMGGGQEGDVRRVIADMIEAGQIPPVLVAAPSSIDPNTMGSAGLSWPAFDLDVFLDRTAERLGAAAVIDRGRVLVAGHSGAGCNIHGGLNAALHAKTTPVLAGFSIDTCMMLDFAKDLAHLRPTTHVIVSWQSMSWPERDFGSFRTVFQREVKKAVPSPGVLRELDYEQPNVPGVHDAMVWLTLRKWLPRLLGPGAPPTPGTEGAEAIVDPAAAKDGGAPGG